eukprot:jgi/Chlat1/8861/Chrsp91S08174
MAAIACSPAVVGRTAAVTSPARTSTSSRPGLKKPHAAASLRRPAYLPVRSHSRPRPQRHIALAALATEEEVAVPEELELENPPRQYETLVVLRPDLTEAERTASSEDYERLLTDNGAMDIELINRGTGPLAYNIKKANPAGEPVTYTDGSGVLFVYTAPSTAIQPFAAKLQLDYDVLRFQTFQAKPLKL